MSGWKTLGQKVIHENRFVRMLEYDVVRPNGNRAPYYVVERPNFSIVVPITSTNETYLVGQYRYPVSRYSWEFPMGAVIGKSFRDMAEQELKEETGIIAKDWIDIGHFHVANGILPQIAHVYIARELKQGVSIPEINEILELKKVSIQKVGEMIASGEMLDGPTICAYHFLEVYLNKMSKLKTQNSKL